MNRVLKKGTINAYPWAGRYLNGRVNLSTIAQVRLPRPKSYENAVEDLNSLQSNLATLENIWKARGRLNQRSLPEMINLCERIGYQVEDFDRLNVIHVTGTKGKGSTCALSESILRNMHGDKHIKTGLFTSPHLIEVRERIRINGSPIDKDSFTRYFYECWERLEETRDKALDDQPSRPSYFRFLNLMAYHIFMQEKVDVAILEVGVGGEYDSTNIVRKPVVCGISALGIDHQAVLGNTIEEIAWHKAGIIKQNVPVFTVPQPEEAMKVIERRASEKNAPLHVIPSHEAIQGLDKISIGLAGSHQLSNSSLAISLCDSWNRIRKCNVSPETVRPLNSVPQEFVPGLKNVKWPGRGQILATPGFTETEWYLDGAHTMESMKACAEWFSNTVDHEDSPVENILLFNSANGRDGLAQIKLLSEIQQKVNFKHAVFCPNLTHSRIKSSADSRNIVLKVDQELSTQRSLANTWTSMTNEPDQHHANLFPDIEKAVNWILSGSNPGKKKRRVLVTGSLHLVGGVMTVLGAECT
ncbi:FolC bifunctional protein [Basidiobolus meristosporus CBS 931.73]|uniref:Folylpolyglutamate synthase n=1 Tax=Basidiobolus meristosporus CBS 931.73 TaxID=1314790 RepID=A0A1Y1Y0N5_9FUNG|nr:FolC bifunctional protein [Basidiobolus meristosporus CBS 931.73]|eukprot:ORX91571.1 FolC bifunctional protein [Basidiobolus meristosporus CBS 931.73]